MLSNHLISALPFCLQSCPASGSFPMSLLLTSDDPYAWWQSMSFFVPLENAYWYMKKIPEDKICYYQKKKKTNENSISTVQKEISLFSVAQVHRLAFRCSVQCPGIKQSFQFHIWRSHTACLWLTATSMKCLSGPFPCSRKCSVCLLWILWDQTQRVWHQRTGLNRAWNLGHCEDGERGELDTSADNLISLIN